MRSSRKNVVRKKRGRPATGQDAVSAVRLSESLKAKIEAWAAKQDDTPSRSEAIRRLVEMALASARPDKPTSKKAAAKAIELAAKVVDNIIDQVAPAAPIEEQKQRKRRLLKGPQEFRAMRADLPKPKR